MPRRCINDFYSTLGFSIGSYPYRYLVPSLVISLALLGGLAQMQFVDDIRTGYAQEGSPSLREHEIYKEFSNFATSPYGMAIAASAKDGGSMLREEHLAEVVRLGKFALQDLNVTVDGNRFTFQNVCKDRCGINYGVGAFMEGLKQQRALLAAGKALDPAIKLDYPLSTYHGTNLMTSYYFFGVKRTPFVSNDTATPIEYVWLVTFWFLGEKGEGATFQGVKDLEMQLYDLSKNWNASKLLDVYVYGDEIANREVIRGAQNTFRNFLVGFFLMFVFVFTTVCWSAPVGERLTIVNFTLVSMTILSPLLAAGSMLGVLSTFGYNINSIMCMTPFLILGIGVDDAFLIIHSWRKHVHEAQHLTVARCMSAALHDVGPSISITSITNTLAFGIGALTPTPQIRMFCVYTALAVFVDFILQLCLFSSMLAIVVGGSTQRRQVVAAIDPGAVRGPNRTEKLLRAYCRFLTSKPAIVGGIVFAVALWSVSIFGMTRMTATFSPEKTLPSDSKLCESAEIVERMYEEQLAVIVIINKPPDITNRTDYRLFFEAVATMESFPNSCEQERNDVWLRQYEEFDKSVHETASMWKDEDLNYTLTYASVPEFLELHPTTKSSVKWSHDKNHLVIVERFEMYMCVKHLSQWTERARMIVEWREVAANYSNFNMTMFVYDSTLYDLILNVNSVTIRAVIITLLCMVAVCLFFIPSVCSVFIASASIVSISVCVVGFLSWLGLDMDPVTMVNILMAVGFNVDYTAHISYHFHKTGVSSVNLSKAERLYETFSAVGFPMIQAAISTAICVLPLCFNTVPVILAFVKTIVLVVIFGLLHGLIILPVALSALPDYYTGELCGPRRENQQNEEAIEELQVMNAIDGQR